MHTVRLRDRHVFDQARSVRVAGALLVALLTLLAGFWIAYATGISTGGPAYGFRATAFAAVAAALCVAHGLVTLGAAYTLRFLGIVAGATLAIEALGVATGAIFGPYAYSAAFPWKLFGLVPAAVPIIWFAMSYFSFETARELLRSSRAASRGSLDRPRTAASGTVLGQAGAAATLLLGYDVVADPNHVFRGGWSYAGGGAFYGVPLRNFVAWFAIGVVLFTLLGRLRSRTPLTASPPPVTAFMMPVGYLAIILHESVFAFAVAGAPAAGAVGLLLAAVCSGLLLWPWRSAALSGPRWAVVRDYWCSVRPVEVLLVTSFPVAGFVLAAAPLRPGQLAALVVCGLGGFCVAGSVYTFNSVEGLPADRLNRRLAGHAIVAGRLPPQALSGLSVALAAAGLIAFAFLGARSVLLAGVVLLCGYLYSSRHIRGKERPGLSSLLHLVGAASFFGAGAGAGIASPLPLVGGVALAVLFMTGHLHHEVIDRRPDREAGLRTLAARCGARPSLVLGSAGFVVFYALIALAWNRGWWPAPLAAPFVAGSLVHAVVLSRTFRRLSADLGAYRYRSFYRALILAMTGIAGLGYLATFR